MIQAIKDFFIRVGGARFAVFCCSLLPIIELRGSIPLGAGLGLHWYENFLISVVGNMLPVPFILLLIRTVLSWFSKSKIRFLNKFSNWLNAKAEKNKEKVLKYSFWGLFLFVAIPLPGTGAWTGSLVAAVCQIPFKRSILAVFLGVLAAGAIMTLASYGFVGFLKIFI